MKLESHHSTPEDIEPSLQALSQGKPATIDYLFIPLYSRRSTPDEQQAWLEGFEEHEKALYDETRLRMELEFNNPKEFNATSYVADIQKGETLHDAVARDLRENLRYNQGETFKIQTIRYRDTVPQHGTDMPRITVQVDLSYAVDISTIKPRGLDVVWDDADEETSAAGPVDHL